MRHSPARVGRGILQSAVPKGPPALESGRAYGLNLRGVVLKLFPRDNPPPGVEAPATTYCSVLTYGKIQTIIPLVQITQPVGGSFHDGQLGGIREATMSTTGILDVDHAVPHTLDGTHVVVSFFDDDLSKPFISRILEHPNADLSEAMSGTAEERARISKDDGRPLLIRWNGAVWGLDGTGDWVLNLEQAHDGALLSDASEPPAASDGSRGNYRIKLPTGAKVTITVGGADALTIEDSASGAKLTLGDGAVHAAIAEHLETLWGQLVTWLSATTVLTALGPSAPLPTLAGPPPAWDATIKASKLKITDG